MFSVLENAPVIGVSQFKISRSCLPFTRPLEAASRIYHLSWCFSTFIAPESTFSWSPSRKSTKEMSKTQKRTGFSWRKLMRILWATLSKLVSCKDGFANSEISKESNSMDSRVYITMETKRNPLIRTRFSLNCKTCSTNCFGNRTREIKNFKWRYYNNSKQSL